MKLISQRRSSSNVARSAHNIDKVKTLRTGYLNVRDLLSYEYVVLSKAALSAVESFFDSVPAKVASSEGGK